MTHPRLHTQGRWIDQIRVHLSQISQLVSLLDEENEWLTRENEKLAEERECAWSRVSDLEEEAECRD